MIACIYLGYTSVNEGFRDDITTMPNPTVSSTIASTKPTMTGIDSTTTMPYSTAPSTTPAATAMNGIDSTTTMPNSTAPTSILAVSVLSDSSGISSSSSTVGITIPSTTSPIITNVMTTKPNLMNNGFKIPQTNLLQSNFNGSSNVYSPYLYVREPFQPVSYDMNNYQQI